MGPPGEELIKLLETLRLRINDSGVERTNGLLQALGDDCSYYRKSLDMFLDRDHDELKSLLTQALSLLNG